LQVGRLVDFLLAGLQVKAEQVRLLALVVVRLQVEPAADYFGPGGGLHKEVGLFPGDKLGQVQFERVFKGGRLTGKVDRVKGLGVAVQGQQPLTV